MDIRCAKCNKLIAKQIKETHTSSTSLDENSDIEYMCNRCKKKTYITIKKEGE